jgi:hypothetical protein
VDIRLPLAAKLQTIRAQLKLAAADRQADLASSTTQGTP